MPSLKLRRARQMSELKSRLKLSDATSREFDRILTGNSMYVRLASRENIKISNPEYIWLINVSINNANVIKR